MTGGRKTHQDISASRLPPPPTMHQPRPRVDANNDSWAAHPDRAPTAGVARAWPNNARERVSQMVGRWPPRLLALLAAEHLIKVGRGITGDRRNLLPPLYPHPTPTPQPPPSPQGKDGLKSKSLAVSDFPSLLALKPPAKNTERGFLFFTWDIIPSQQCCFR